MPALTIAVRALPPHAPVDADHQRDGQQEWNDCDKNDERFRACACPLDGVQGDNNDDESHSSDDEGRDDASGCSCRSAGESAVGASADEADDSAVHDILNDCLDGGIHRV